MISKGFGIKKATAQQIRGVRAISAQVKSAGLTAAATRKVFRSQKWMKETYATKQGRNISLANKAIKDAGRHSFRGKNLKGESGLFTQSVKGQRGKHFIEKAMERTILAFQSVKLDVEKKYG